MTVCKAVMRPSLTDMMEICKMLYIPFVVENKAYPRDWMSRGRIRVKLSGLAETVNTKMKLMSKMGSMIPQLKSYTERIAKEEAMLIKVQSEGSDQHSKKAAKSKRK